MFIIQVKDQNYQPYSKAEVEITILNYIFSPNDAILKISCDFSYLRQRLWFYEFIRTLRPCQMKMKGISEITDESGLAYYRNFTFEKAPEGSYFLKFKVKHYSLQSKTYNIMLSPDVLDIWPLNNPPQNAKIN